MSATTETPPPPAPPRRFETQHRGIFHGADIAYRCVAGETHLPDAKGDPRASIFSAACRAFSAVPSTVMRNASPNCAPARSSPVSMLGSTAWTFIGPNLARHSRACPGRDDDQFPEARQSLSRNA